MHRNSVFTPPKSVETCAPLDEVSLDRQAAPAKPYSAKDAGIECLDSYPAFVAFSPAMRDVRRKVKQVAAIDTPVLLLGESGTGKEVVARLIHMLSARAPHRFLKVNCAALPVDLLESELFGHEVGAFTGACQNSLGKFEYCHKGTILLDELGEMPIPPQAKLLHVLQDGEFSRLGSTHTRRVDVRVLAATNVNVRTAVRNGTFRMDLYYRLNVFTIELPPLRERKEDLPHLLNHFMMIWAARYGRPPLEITRRILEACESHHWPGNVRELENFVKRYLVQGDQEEALSQLGCEINRERTARFDDRAMINCNDLKSLVRDQKQETERDAIRRALDDSNGSKQIAASRLGISIRALHYKVRLYGIETGRVRNQSA
jgi:two-component system, NtrC family, response regulator AtoC